jgi:hypothetical protein
MPLTLRRLPLPVLAAFTAVALTGFGAWAILGRAPLADAPPSEGASLAFAEFGAVADRVYLASPSNPADRRLIATVDHVEGWGINPAFSVAGGLAAYTVLPPGSIPRRDSPAELWLLDLRSGESSRIARDADLLAPPAFDANGRTLLYRSTRHDGRQELVSVDLKSRVRRPVHSYEGAFGLHPIGFAADGAVVFAELSAKGTDVYRPSSSPTPLTRSPATGASRPAGPPSPTSLPSCWPSAGCTAPASSIWRVAPRAPCPRPPLRLPSSSVRCGPRTVEA